MSSLSTLPKGDSAWLLRKAIERILDQVSVLETNIGVSTSGNSANTQIIFNDDGTLRGDAGLVYNKTTDALTVGGAVNAASATITGDLTVGTGSFGAGLTGALIGTGKQLVFNNASSNNTGYISNADNACIYTSGSGGTFGFNGHLVLQPRGSAAGAILFGTGNGAAAMVERYKIDSTGIATWSNVGGVAGVGMTLNSTGLGVGVTPSTKLHIGGTGSQVLRVQTSTSGDPSLNLLASGVNDAVIAYDRTNNYLRFDVSAVIGAFILGPTGNVGVGVTPSATNSTYYQALEIGRVGQGLTGAKTALSSSPNSWLSNNSYATYSAGIVWNYAVSQPAAQYRLLDATHLWYTAASGTAGNPITFTQAMTLAANGQLLLGTSTTSSSIDIGMVMNKPSATGFVGNVYQLNSVDKAFTYIASAASALRIDTVAGYTVNVVSGGTNGVYLGNGGVAWLALSDERFKDIIEPISNAVAKVGSLRSVIGKFKTDSEGTRRSFLLAQDVQAVLPEAVDATKPEQLGLSYSEVVPLLVAAIKELTARVQTLEAR
jgi:hypothetical protein